MSGPIALTQYAQEGDAICLTDLLNSHANLNMQLTIIVSPVTKISTMTRSNTLPTTNTLYNLCIIKKYLALWILTTYIYMSHRTANLQTLHFKYLLNKYTY
jgi:hypothetical protein